MTEHGDRADPQAQADAEESLPDVFWSVARQLRQRHREALAPWEVTPAQFRAIGTLIRHGPMRLSALSEKLRIAPRSTTEVVDALQERGLAERLPDPDDRRATLVRPTERGTAMADALRASRDSGALDFFARLDEHDRAELTRILLALRG